MKYLIVLLITLSLICIGCNKNSNILASGNSSFLDSDDAYFGLTAPGLTPKVFAPGIVSDSSWAEHCNIAFSPRGDEIYWSAWTADYQTEDGSQNTEQIFYSKYDQGSWTEPQLAEFTSNNRHGLNGGPVFSPDGKRLYFYQVKSPWTTSDMNTYYIEEVDGQWSSDPVEVGLPYNTENMDYSPIFTHIETAYKYRSGNVTKYRYSNNQFKLLEDVTFHEEFTPRWNFYMHPEEDYVIFAAMHQDGFGDVDLYISFKDETDNWSYPLNMGDKINSSLRERFPVVSPDGKYLFFMRHTETQDFFWVSTQIIIDLKKQYKEIK